MLGTIHGAYSELEPAKAPAAFAALVPPFQVPFLDLLLLRFSGSCGGYIAFGSTDDAWSLM
jgi:hypothetical protein